MLRHLLKLIWKRKSRNMMLSLEILLAFLIVFAIVAFGVRSYQLYQMPTGFDWRDQWSVSIRTGQGDMPNEAAMYDTLKRSLLDLPEVENVAFTSFGMYEMSRWTAKYTLPDGSKKTVINQLAVSDDFFAATAMAPAEGRWFSTADDGADAVPVVINRRLANELFPGKPAVGQILVESVSEGKKEAPERYRVSAVIEQANSAGHVAIDSRPVERHPALCGSRRGPRCSRAQQGERGRRCRGSDTAAQPHSSAEAAAERPRGRRLLRRS